MKNKHYNIFFTSEKDGLGKSFRVSKVSLFVAIFLFSGAMIFSYLGFNRVIGNDNLTYELKQLREYKYITSNLLVESGMKAEFVTSEDLEKVIVDYIIANNIVHPNSPPVNGYVTKGVVRNNNEIIHAGINVASKLKDEVKSPLDGVVIVAEQNDELESTIIIHHQNNFFTIYKNLDILLVQARDLIMKNQTIATVGGGMNGDGPHLHFEIWKDNQIIDPRNLIADYKEKDVSIR